VKNIFNFFIKKSQADEIQAENILNKSLPLISINSKEKLIDILVNDNQNELDLNITVWDDLFAESARLFFDTGNITPALLYEKFEIDYDRACLIYSQLERFKIISPYSGNNPRFMLVSNRRKLEYLLNQISLDKGKINQFYLENKNEIDSKRAILAKQKIDEQIEEEKEEIKEKLKRKEHQRSIQRLAREELAKENNSVDTVPDKREKREPIPQDIMDKVWNRDGGKCVKCGSQENLEFDHIIPFSKGGATTYRNLQLLCKNCNLEKLDNIG
jgi:hypothetical protein